MQYNKRTYSLSYLNEVKEGYLIKNRKGVYHVDTVSKNGWILRNIVDGGQYLITELSKGNFVYK